MVSLNIVSVIITLCIVNASFAVQIDITNPIVSTRYGQVQGKTYDGTNSGTNQKRVIQFIGIPYARPPNGANRFMPPSAPDSWSGIKDCTKNRVMCPQVEQRFRYQNPTPILEDEDCLHLNVYVPVSVSGFAQNLPVLVYFHGGEFKYGGKDFYRPDFIFDNTMNAMNDPGMIVVTANYRLGVLGFLSTDDINQPGNNGLRDQTQALRWVNENIGTFNGNPGNITIMGHDAGAISVSMHILNQESWPYFSTAISIGGTVFTPWAFEDNPVQMAINMGNFFKCDLKTDRLIECLRTQDVNALMGKSRDRDWDRNYLPYWFRPVIDRNVSGSAIFRDYPLMLYQTGQFKKPCPYMVGVTSKEGSLEYYLQANRVNGKPTIEEKIAYLIRPFLLEYASEDILASAIKYQYFKRNTTNRVNGPYGASQINRSPQYNRLQNNVGNPNSYPYNPQGIQTNPAFQQINNNYIDEADLYVQMLSDFLYNAPADYALRMHSGGGAQAWQFVFDFEGGKTFGTLQINAGSATLKQYGATHMDDLFYILPNEYSLDTSLGYDKVVANTYTSSLMNFARRGSMTGSGLNSWQPYTQYQSHFYRFMGNGQGRPETSFRNDQADFWNDFIYDLQRKTGRAPTPFPYEQYRGYQAATWSMVAVVLLLILILVALCAIFVMRRKRQKQSLKLLRRQDKELEERGSATEKL